MGFLEGFAEGFVPSYAQSVKADKDKEQTILQSGLASFKARQDAYLKAKEEDGSRVKTASNLVSEFGFGPEMHSYVYTRLSNGETVNQIRQDLETGKFTTPDGKPIARPGMQPGSVDKQTSDAGLAPATPTADAPSVSGKPATLAYASSRPTSEYGVARSTGNHGGIDFAMPKSTPVGALQGGVAERGYDDLSGNYVRVRHPNGYVSTYAHLDSPNIQDGQEVKPGDVIGFSGNTGRVRGANGGYHLHLGVRDPEGNRIDPRPFIQDSLASLSSNQNTNVAANKNDGPSEEFKTAFADLASPSATEMSGELPANSDIVVEGRPVDTAPTAAPAKAEPEKPARRGDGFGYDAQGRAMRGVVQAAGGMEVYNQILQGYQPNTPQSNVRYTPGRKSGTVPTLEQLRVMRAQAASDGNTEEVTRLDGMISSVVGSQAQADALRDRQSVQIVLPDGKLKGGYVATDSTGKPVLMDEAGNRITTPGARRVFPDEINARTEVIKATEASNSRYRTQLEGTISALPLAYDVITIAKRDPRVLTTTAKVVGQIKTLGTEVVTAFNVAEGIFAAKSRGNPNDTVYATEQEIESGLRRAGYLNANETLEQRASRAFSLGNDANSLAENAKLMEAKLLLAAVRFGAMEGQSGQGFSNKDFDRFLTIVGGGSTNVNTFARNLTDYMKGRVDSINTQARILNDPRSGLAANFKATYGYNPTPAVPTLDDMVRDMGGKHAAALAFVRGGQPDTEGQPQRRPQQQSQTRRGDANSPDVTVRGGKTYSRIGRTPDGKTVYRGPDGKNYVF